MYATVCRCVYASIASNRLSCCLNDFFVYLLLFLQQLHYQYSAFAVMHVCLGVVAVAVTCCCSVCMYDLFYIVALSCVFLATSKYNIFYYFVLLLLQWHTKLNCYLSPVHFFPLSSHCLDVYLHLYVNMYNKQLLQINLAWRMPSHETNSTKIKSNKFSSSEPVRYRPKCCRFVCVTNEVNFWFLIFFFVFFYIFFDSDLQQQPRVSLI